MNLLLAISLPFIFTLVFLFALWTKSDFFISITNGLFYLSIRLTYILMVLCVFILIFMNDTVLIALIKSGMDISEKTIYFLFDARFNIITITFYIVIFFILSKYLISTAMKLLPQINSDFNKDTYEYGKWGRLWFWYNATYKYNKKRGMIDSLSHSIRQNSRAFEVIDQEYIVASPSANKGRYEKELTTNLSKDRNNILILASDIENIPDHANSEIYNDNVEFRYLKGRNDANELNEMLATQGVDSVHVIWDNKGAAWHSTKRLVALEKLFISYHKALDQNGMIIFDAYKISKKTLYRNNLLFHMFNIFLGYGEVSTFSKIAETITESKFIGEHFEIVLQVEGKYCWAIFKKRQ